MPFIERHQEWGAALVLGLVGGFGIATTWQSTTSKDFWDIATAVGTVGAVVVALWIALAGSAQRRREVAEVAGLASARVSAVVEQSMPFLTYALNWASEEGALSIPTPQRFASFQRTLDSAQIEIESADLLALVPLPKRCAHRLARAVAILGAVRREAVALNLYFDPAEGTFNLVGDRRAELYSKWHKQLGDAMELLVVVRQVCAQSAHISAPLPDDTEIIRIAV